jgi:endonuclease/exonuclease/phosphatase (EEP) superfamily protein YafD
MSRLGADRWWFGALNLYLPQVIWLVPGIFLAFICLLMARHWIFLPLLCVAWVLGPIMGFCWPLHMTPNLPAGIPLRVMTWNVHNGEQDKLAVLAIMREIDLNQPDIIFLQAASSMLNGPLGNYFRKWNVQNEGEYIIASRLPLAKAENRPPRLSGEEENCLRCRLQIGPIITTVYNIHFKSPRDGLGAVAATRKNPSTSTVQKAILQLEDNVSIRLEQALRLGELISLEKGPVIIAGDFNSSEYSQVCAKLRDVGLHDAFAEGGHGYGYTYGHFLLRHLVSFMRIDHIMMSSQIRTQRSWTGTWQASAHRPVISDLVLDGK